MKIMTYNILDGCLENDRFTKLLAFLSRESPDILLLNECNHWEDNDEHIVSIKKNAALCHHIFCKTESGYHMVLFSKIPFINSRTFTKRFHHGGIQASLKHKTGMITLIGTHLSPSDEDKRLDEMQEILSTIQDDENCILKGDLNSLSPADNYDIEDYQNRIYRQGITKFGDEKPRYDVISKILNSTFIDSMSKGNGFQPTIPTSLNSDTDHAMGLRLDYLFIASELAHTLSSAKTIQDESTEKISDHYPVVIDLEMND